MQSGFQIAVPAGYLVLGCRLCVLRRLRPMGETLPSHTWGFLMINLREFGSNGHGIRCPAPEVLWAYGTRCSLF